MKDYRSSPPLAWLCSTMRLALLAMLALPGCLDFGPSDFGRSVLSLSGSCSNGVKDGAESDVDCGATCSGCGVGQQCVTMVDCAVGACYASVCIGHQTITDVSGDVQDASGKVRVRAALKISGTGFLPSLPVQLVSSALSAPIDLVVQDASAGTMTVALPASLSAVVTGTTPLAFTLIVGDATAPVTLLQGEAGPTGPTGATGDVGPRGQMGDMGPVGDPGGTPWSINGSDLSYSAGHVSVGTAAVNGGAALTVVGGLNADSAVIGGLSATSIDTPSFTGTNVNVSALSATSIVTSGVSNSGNYAFSLPRPHYLTLGPANFTTYGGAVTINIIGTFGVYLYTSPGSTDGFVHAPVRLPDGAIITGVSCRVYDFDVANDMTVSFFSGTGTQPGGSAGTSSGSTGNPQTVSVGPWSNVITSDATVYWVRVHGMMSGSGGLPPTSGLSLEYCRVAYTVSAAD